MSDTEVLDYEEKRREIVDDMEVERRDGDEPQEEQPEKKPFDHQGLQASDGSEPQEEVVYEIKDEPSFHVTRALFIANLRRPLNAIHFQNYMKTLAKEAGDYAVERAWLNRTRTHGIVLLDNEAGAEYIRSKILGSIYPSASDDSKLSEEYESREEERYEQQLQEYNDAIAAAANDEEKDALTPPIEPRKYSVERIPLFVDYIPVKAINQWVFEEDRGPRNGKWKIDYESKSGDEVIASHILLNGDFIPRRYPGRDYRGRGGYRRDAYTPEGSSGRRDYGGYNRGGDYRDNRGGDNYYRRPYDRPYDRPYERRDRDQYVPGQSSDRRRNRTDSYEPSRHRERSPTQY
ncbi:hypothetical protein DFJ63DRAFT_139186 [Scheffersomyces coipomensis]|uniref:uncharacterized protein n=1 Tax=Scheffersomyces coipomensis TaxID=1788519 RepID=UPI00315D4DA5